MNNKEQKIKNEIIEIINNNNCESYLSDILDILKFHEGDKLFFNKCTYHKQQIKQGELFNNNDTKE